MLSDLPVLVLDEVCGHLSYDDVFALRCTCKTLREFVDGKRFTKLNLFVRKFAGHCRLFYTGGRVGYCQSLHSGDLTILSSTRFREQFVNLQRMVICIRRKWIVFDDCKTEFDLNSLNCFRGLTQLQIENNRYLFISGKLNLQELRVAAFELAHGDANIELDCPKLRALSIGRCAPVLTAETNQLDYLRYYPYMDSNYLESITNRNLQKLSTFCLKGNGLLLEFLSKLKAGTLKFASLLQIEIEKANQFRLLCLASLLEDLRKDNRTKHIEFIFNGRLIRSPDELRQITNLFRAHDFLFVGWERMNFTSLEARSLQFLNENAELECLLSSDFSLHLSEDVDLPEELIERLRNVEFLEFKDQYKPSYSTFELFARSCESLRRWCLSHQTLTVRLLEMLSKHLVDLEVMEISECEVETLKPLGKFRNLVIVEFDFEATKEELTSLYENSQTLESIKIHGKIEIDLLRSKKCNRVIFTVFPNFEFDSLPQMIDYYGNKLRGRAC